MKYLFNRKHGRPPSGFSLVELLVVLGMIVFLTGMSIVSMQGMKRASELSQAMESLSSELALARQASSVLNRPHEVRFYRYADPAMPGSTEAYRAFQILEQSFEPDPGAPDYVSPGAANFTPATTPIGKVIRLPRGIVLIEEANLSTLLTDTSRIPAEDETVLPGGVPATYTRMSFKPGGGTDLDLSNQWFLTIAHERPPRTGSEPPPNFATLQIDPYSGKMNWYRP